MSELAINTGSTEEVRKALLACCGSERWVGHMIALRPFRDLQHIDEESSRIWWSLDASDWHEAFSHHPRIGERKSESTAKEQAGALSAGDQIKSALAEGNRVYEERFGHIYLVCASGKSGEELLAILHSRLGNAPADELKIAAGEQEKITHLRLRKWLVP